MDRILFHLGKEPVTVGLLVTGCGIALSGFIISWLVQVAARRAARRRSVNIAELGGILRLFHYVILAIAFAIALQTMGIKLATLFAAGAIFAVGIGFAMKNIVENFVGGIILTTERSILVGHVVDVGGTIVRIKKVGIRCSIGEGRDGQRVILPNSLLVQDTVTNYSLEKDYRVRIVVGVSYDSNMQLVEETLLTIANQYESHGEIEPEVLLESFGESSVNFELAVPVYDPWMTRITRHELYKKVWKAFKQNGIVIAYPQLDVHLDSKPKAQDDQSLAA